MYDLYLNNLIACGKIYLKFSNYIIVERAPDSNLYRAAHLIKYPSVTIYKNCKHVSEAQLVHFETLDYDTVIEKLQSANSLGSALRHFDSIGLFEKSKNQ